MTTRPNDELEEHRNYCIVKAQEADRLAASASGKARDQYLDLARSWRQLIHEIEDVMQERELTPPWSVSSPELHLTMPR